MTSTHSMRICFSDILGMSEPFVHCNVCHKCNPPDGKRFADRLLALPVEIRNHIWDSLGDGYSRPWHPHGQYDHRYCWAYQKPLISRCTVALLRINKAFNNEITRWLCHRLKTAKFCEAECFFKYCHYGIARRALQWTNTITCRMENVSEGTMNWVVLYMVWDLWRNNSDWWTLGVEEDAEPVEWVVAGKSWSVSNKSGRPVGGWDVTLKSRRLTE